jgi:hypothetical protein
MPNCGECLWNDVEVIALDATGNRDAPQRQATRRPRRSTARRPGHDPLLLTGVGVNESLSALDCFLIGAALDVLSNDLAVNRNSTNELANQQRERELAAIFHRFER